MKGAFRLQMWAGPLVIGSFAVMAVTGIMMFFHWNIGAVKLAHEWLGWLLVIGGIAHLLVNWRPFLGYFRRPTSVVIAASVALLGFASLLPLGGSSRRPPLMNVSRALEQSSLSVVAQVVKRDVQEMKAELAANGIRVRHEEQTIADIAADNGRPAMQVLASVFGDVGSPRSDPPERKVNQAATRDRDDSSAAQEVVQQPPNQRAFGSNRSRTCAAG